MLFLRRVLFFLILILFSCNDFFRDYDKYPKINDLNRLLKKIHDLEFAKDYNGLKYYIYSCNYKKGNIKFNSQNMIIKNIKDSKDATGKKNSDFMFYSRTGFFYHAQFVNSEMTKKGDERLIKKYLIDTDILNSDKRLQNIFKESKENFLIYENFISAMVVVNDRGEYKILFLHNMGVANSDKPIDYSKLKW